MLRKLVSLSTIEEKYVRMKDLLRHTKESMHTRESKTEETILE
jgi:hypothetical protein